MADLSSRFLDTVVHGLLSESCNSTSVEAELKTSLKPCLYLPFLDKNRCVTIMLDSFSGYLQKNENALFAGIAQW